MSTLNVTNVRCTNVQNSSGTNCLELDSSARVKKNSQPAFYANSGQGNFTIGNGSDIPLESTRFNRGSHYNTGNYRFTAPVDGIYLFTFGTFVITQTNRMTFKLNGGSISGLQQLCAGTGQLAVIVNLSANDYITVGDWQSISGGVIYRGHSQFSGTLLS